MAEQHFTHLHLHTDFSLLDGAISLDKLISFAKANSFKAIGISDHGNIFGAVKFFEKCKKAGIKPILGMEAYITDDVTIKTIDKRYYHQLLIVENAVGYKNLCKLISFAYQKGFYFKPRIDYEILQQHSEGLIVSSACLGGHIPQLILSKNEDQALERIDWFIDVFGKDRFFLEVQPEEQAEQKIVNAKLFEYAALKGLDVIATCDSHYPSASDREAHEIMLAIQTHDKMDNPERYSFGECRVHLRTKDEMMEVFKEHPEAIWNTGKLADRCTFAFETGKLFFPKFEIPQEHTQESFFKAECRNGLQRLLDEKLIPAEQETQYRDRLELEIDLITKMGFIGYFLIVSDFIKWAHRNGVPVGPGRGSAAGSLVSWALEITNIDPLKYNLLFERFLNPERITMPDIDIDFCIEGRERVIDYVREKYGHDKVCQIVTFGTMLAKAAIKDVARALSFSFEDSNAITNLVPDQLKITLNEAIEQEPRLQELIKNNPKVKHLFDVAFKLEGLTRHASKHACGLVISPEPIDEVLPVYIPPKSTELITQYAMTELETLGFLKIDFLGLKNLTLIARALALIEKNHGIKLDMNHLALDDQKTFTLIGEGKTSGVFQLESDGLKDVLRKLRPQRFEDIIAVNALYRPGPLGSGMVDDFIERKHGRQKIVYLFPELEPVLAETYGVIVYQEQVMKIASTIAGYSLGESDILRRAMGKKKVEVMAAQRELFLKRAEERKFDGKKAGELFDLMAYFAGYGFNKSHSAAYALIAYQTAYLKAHYPAEFMACLISLEATNAEKMSFYLDEAKGSGLTLLPPDINRSLIDFSVVDGNLLFGLQGIKNVGLTALENIIAEQQKKPFVDLLDFCKRIDLRTTNKRVIENLICAGAFDQLPGNRAQKYTELATIMDQAAEYKKNKLTGQMGLFGASSSSADKDGDVYTFAPLPEWSTKEKLEKENDVIGFYLSFHPLDGYKEHVKRLTLQTIASIMEQHRSSQPSEHEPIVTVCGFVKNRKDIFTKKGDRMSFVQLEDTTSSAEIIVFPKLFANVESLLDAHQVFVIKGNLDAASSDKCKIKALECVPIELIYNENHIINGVTLRLPEDIQEDTLATMSKTITKGSLPLDFVFTEQGKQVRLITGQKIALTPELLSTLDQGHVDIMLHA